MEYYQQVGWRPRIEFLTILTIFLVLFLVVAPIGAEPFYQGRMLRIIAPLSVGGGNDLMARLVARWLPKYIPGNPAVVVQNLPGAGGLVGTNYVYNVSKADGLTLLSGHGPVIFAQLIGAKGVKFDFSRFEVVGSVRGSLLVFVVRADLPYKTAQDLRTAKEPLSIAATGPTSFSALTARTLLRAGYNVRVTAGYRGHTDVYRALAGGEVDAGTVAATHAVQEQKELRPLFWVSTQVPYWTELPHLEELVASREMKSLARAISLPDDVGRTYVAPPQTPHERVKILREAFEKVVKDPGFRDQVAELGETLLWRDAKQTRSLLQEVIDTPAPVVAELKKMMSITE